MRVGSETKVKSRTPPESDTPVFPGFLHTTRGSLQKREAGQYVNTDFVAAVQSNQKLILLI